jgi:hypothetical protein
VSPILVRPVREQLEHDRVIRLLQAKSRRKFDAGINPGAEQNVSVGSGALAVYPDVVLASPGRGRRIEAVIEVETGESVNHLEALAQWAHFARLRPPFHLYVPSTMVEVARRLCDDNHIGVSEIWSYHGLGDDLRFTLVHRTKALQATARRPGPVHDGVAARTTARTGSARPTRTVRPGRAVKGSVRKKAAVKKTGRSQKRK